ncbi:MAG: putative cytoplasmic protein [Proteobacteria bacterium]|nr:putative cytoplasmic protein [Pseudomonadota bacterium]
MSDRLFVRWTIVPRDCPRPVFACPTCGGDRPFHPSGKIRLNANGKRLDAWLIYKCDACDRTWNRPIFERRLTTDLPPGDLAALRAGDPALVRRLAFDLTALRRKTSVIVHSDALDVGKAVTGGDRRATGVEVAFAVPYPVGLRLDRLLATELGLARSRIAALADAGRLKVAGGASALNRPPRDGQGIRLDLDGVNDRETIVAAVG